MSNDEIELVDNFRELSPENQRIALANIRLANVTENAARKAVLNGHYPEHRDRSPAPMGAAMAEAVNA